MDNPLNLATEVTQDEEKQNKNTTQNVLDTTIRIRDNLNFRTKARHTGLFYLHDLLLINFIML
jgi:hypothetical protein